MTFESWKPYARGWLFHFLGQDARAYPAYAEAFAVDPTNADAVRHLGFIAAKRKDHSAAEEWLQVAAKLAPADASSHFNLGFVQGELGKHREALASHEASTRLNPNFDRAWYGLGLAHLALGAPDQAIPAFEEATRLQPMNGHAWYQLGMACHRAGHADRVETTLKKLLGFDPKIARQLVRDSGRSDLSPLLPQLPF